MMHLAMFLANLDGGGAERMMVHLAAGLADRGVRVDLVLARASGPYLRELPPSVRVVDLQCGSASRAVPALARYLRAERPDVLLVTLMYVSLAAAMAHLVARSGALLFVREANTPSRLPVTSLKDRLIGWSMRWVYARAHRVLAVSEGVAEDVVRTRGVPASKVVTVYNPVVTPEVVELARHDPGHAWFEPGGPPVVLGVGSLGPRKDFATLVDAFARLRERRAARLVILGEGPLREDLERRAAALGLAGDVRFPGFVPNPFAFMARASVFVLSSVVEGLPGVLIQAMACGCPVVATDCPSGPHEILDGGRFGELVPMRDPAVMAAAIERALDTPPDRGTLRGRSEMFAADRVVAAHHTELERALAARSERAGRRGAGVGGAR